MDAPRRRRISVEPSPRGTTTPPGAGAFSCSCSWRRAALDLRPLRLEPPRPNAPCALPRPPGPGRPGPRLKPPEPPPRRAPPPPFRHRCWNRTRRHQRWKPWASSRGSGVRRRRQPDGVHRDVRQPPDGGHRYHRDVRHLRGEDRRYHRDVRHRCHRDDRYVPDGDRRNAGSRRHHASYPAGMRRGCYPGGGRRAWVLLPALRRA